MAERKAASSDGTTPVTDAPPQDEVKVEDKVFTDNSALKAVSATGPVEPLPADADYVQYKGRATMRRITVGQWQQARVEDQGEVTWDKSNGFRVPLSDLNDAALAALGRDNNFALPDRS
jgi:hypothetical protein